MLVDTTPICNARAFGSRAKLSESMSLHERGPKKICRVRTCLEDKLPPKLVWLRTLKYSARNCSEVRSPIGNLRARLTSQSAYCGPTKEPLTTVPNAPPAGFAKLAGLR